MQKIYINSSFPVENDPKLSRKSTLKSRNHPKKIKSLPPVTCPCPGCCKASDYVQHGIGRNRQLGRPWQGSQRVFFSGKKIEKAVGFSAAGPGVFLFSTKTGTQVHESCLYQMCVLGGMQYSIRLTQSNPCGKVR